MFFKKIYSFAYNFFVSLRLAVFTLTALAVLTAVGTFVEARYDQEFANKLVYHSFWMALIMILLAVNLTMVLIDRWPWKKKHTPFILAHFGILILLLGSVFTKYLGVDASLSFKEGESSSEISLSDMEVKVYSSFDGEAFSLLYEKALDMLFIKPTEKKPYLIETAGEEFKVLEYLPFAVGRKNFKVSLKGGQPALRFHLFGSRANLVEWLYLNLGQTVVSKKFGPAVISLTMDKNYKPQAENEMILLVKDGKLFYSIYQSALKKTGEALSSSKNQSLDKVDPQENYNSSKVSYSIKRGSLQKKQKKISQNQRKLLKVGQTFQTGWMDFEFRLLEFFPKAQREIVFTAQKKPSENTVKAIRVSHKDQSFWIGQNSYANFFKKDKMYVLTYRNQTQPLPFSLKLIDFKVTNYQGSNKAKSYESLVELKDSSQVLISMNEPLKRMGWTFYQSSFIEPEGGVGEYVSVLSVNRDPGRFLKYLGSALIVLGIIFLFYRRKLR